jgi:hypothetical protein
MMIDELAIEHCQVSLVVPCSLLNSLPCHLRVLQSWIRGEVYHTCVACRRVVVRLNALRALAGQIKATGVDSKVQGMVVLVSKLALPLR